jgi:hypothetical protein
MKLNKKTIIAASIIGVLAIGGGTGIVVHNNQVYAQQAAKKEKESKAAYKQLKKDAKSAIDTAYDTRKDEDITLAQEAVEKLKEKDQKDFKLELATLKAFLSQIKETNKLIDTAEKSKKDDDVKAAQTAIDGEKDDYLEKDKKAHQERLDKIKKSISDQKAKAEKEKKAAEDKKAADEKAKAEAEQAAQAQQAQAAAQTAANTETAAPAAEGTYTGSGGATDPGAGGGYYPNDYQAPQNQAPAAPAQPSQPSTGGGGGGGTAAPPGGMTQDQLDQSAKEQYDPSKDPNSPWYNK